MVLLGPQVVFLILFKVSLAEEPLELKPLGDDEFTGEFWTTLVQNVIDLFHHQPSCDRAQFGVIFLGNPENHNLNMYVYPHVGTNVYRPVTDNNHPFSPSNPSDFGNYVVSRPGYIPQLQDVINAEEISLGHIQRLWNNYINRFNQTPTLMLHYSWIMPCEQCVDLILNYFNSEPYVRVPHRVVAHTTEGHFLSYISEERNANTRERLRNAGIRVLTHQCYSPQPSNIDAVFNISKRSLIEASDKATTEIEMEQPITEKQCMGKCLGTETLQGCLYSCLLKTSVCCCCQESYKERMTVDYVNRFMAYCRNKNLKNCAQEMIASTLGNACTCNPKEVFVDNMNQCLTECSNLPMSKPLNPYSPSTFTGMLQRLDELSIYPQEVSLCTDRRMQGTICSEHNQIYMTAGSSICREDTPCDFYGESYKWCYTVNGKKKWDYCCTDACARRGENYYWCHSGSTWQYCGNPGTKTVHNMNCLPTSPCGLHLDVNSRTDYYWCYVDEYLHYGRCCQPGFPCKKYGYSYNWCWTGYKIRSGKWNKCEK
ncbi:uncharacterized protein LOC128231708 [Mya arenaria]|uniref:uncharacterized protein LOC128231708 n=1 Tax=Mya arenaria TaxID=6604 RepID=UPI0022E73D06|nr:uncharacterized protein LOC128231708 [Mya arenaria]